MRILRLSLVLLALTLPAAAVGQQKPADPLVGCYRLMVGPWEPPLHPGNAVYQTPPERFRLSEETGEGPFERGRTLVRPVIPHGRTPSAYWQRVDSDSVRVVWTNGFAGVRLHLQLAADSLRGTARTFTDVVGGPPAPQAEAVARRTACRPGER